MRCIVHAENEVAEWSAPKRRPIGERGNIFADILIGKIVGLKFQPLRLRIFRPQNIDKFYKVLVGIDEMLLVFASRKMKLLVYFII